MTLSDISRNWWVAVLRGALAVLFGVVALVWPGMQFQRLTTREPDLSMCAVAIQALERVRGDETVVRLEGMTGEVRPEVAFIQ